MKIPVHINDLIAKGADEGDIENEAEDLVNDSAQTTVDAFLIIGQLDPLDTFDGKPRWTDGQRQLIMDCNEKLTEYTD